MYCFNLLKLLKGKKIPLNLLFKGIDFTKKI